MVTSKTSKLEEVLKNHQGENHLIALRGSPDPDCLSSALAHQFILEYYEIESLISHACKLSHEENRAHVKLLGTELLMYSPKNSYDSFNGYSLVDSQRPDDEFEELLRGKALITVVDHHDSQNGLNAAEFVDIRKDVGATATIYTEYLKDLKLLTEQTEKSQLVATALMHGIMTDTDDLLHAFPSDYKAISYLSDFANLPLLRKISKQSLTEQTMDTIVRAYKNKKVNGSYLLSGVGLLKKTDRDALPQSADFLMQIDGISTVLVYGIIDNCIDCSLRTKSDKVNPSEFLIDAFPELEHSGRYGGRHDKGGFLMRLGPVLSYLRTDEDDIVQKAVDSYMENRFMDYIGERKKVSSKKSKI